MKTSAKYLFLFFIAGLFAACSTSYAPYAYDDLYYNPKNDPINKVKKDPREDFNKTNKLSYDGSYENRYVNEENNSTYPESIYQNRYTQAEALENNQPSDSYTNNSTEEVTYYDEDYARSLNQINSPVRSFNTYDPYQRDRILYTQDPFFAAPVLYGNYWDPFMPRTTVGIGWNSFNGWNVGVGYGVGFGFNRFRNNFYNPYGFGFYDPWNPFGFHPYGLGFGGFGYGGFGFNNYMMGYNQGFMNGFYSRNYYRNHNHGGGIHIDNSNTSNRRNLTTPRGSSGSPTYTRGDVTNRPTREVRKLDGNAPKSGDSPSARPSREGVRTNTPTRSATPERYRSANDRNSYTRPAPNARPSRTITPNNESPMNTTPRTVNPRNNNSYNQPSRPAPRQYESRPQQVQPNRQYQPQQQTRPSRSTPNFNRSTPSYNRSTPSYTPSSPSFSPSRSSGDGGGGRSTPSRPSRSGGR
tara:strand:- start:4922 stop:6322 length:1401 start_codon:yes stop_codon:yes gene_type:complete